MHRSLMQVNLYLKKRGKLVLPLAIRDTGLGETVQNYYNCYNVDLYYICHHEF